jgi:hypothetical protein
MPNNSGPNKRMNGPDGRVRNTSTSNQMRVPGVPQGGGKPPTMPNFGASYGDLPGATGTAAAMWAGLQQTVAAAEAKRKGNNAAFKTERANARAGAIGSMSEVINGAIDNGMLGSSAAGAQAIGVLADRRQQIEAANTTRKQANIDLKVGVQQAYTSFAIQDAQLKMQAAAARTQAALAQQAIDAQNAATAAFSAALPGSGAGAGGGSPIVIGGKSVPVTKLPDGRFEVGGLLFDRGTPIPTIINSIKRRRGETQAMALSGMFTPPPTSQYVNPLSR